MNKDAIRIFNAFVDRQLELTITQCNADKDLKKLRTETIRHAGWRKRGDYWTSKELEKEYGKLT